MGFHFFNPVAMMPLLEIVRGEATDDATLATAFAVGRQLKKSCVLVKDAPAFVVNRILTRFLGEIWNAVDAGTPLKTADRALDPLGLPMRPMALLPWSARPWPRTWAAPCTRRSRTASRASPNLAAIAKSGLPLLGRRRLNPEVEALLVQGDAPLTGEQVARRRWTRWRRRSG